MLEEERSICRMMYLCGQEERSTEPYWNTGNISTLFLCFINYLLLAQVSEEINTLATLFHFSFLVPFECLVLGFLVETLWAEY